MVKFSFQESLFQVETARDGHQTEREKESDRRGKQQMASVAMQRKRENEQEEEEEDEERGGEGRVDGWTGCRQRKVKMSHTQ